MVFGMAWFALGDLFFKLAVVRMPLPQAVLVSSAGGFLIFLAIALVRRHRVIRSAFFAPPVVLRNVTEVIGAIGITTGLALTELSTASALMQMVPLVAMVFAAMFLGEQVGWRRWTSVLVGFFGVLIILRPAAGLDPGGIAILIGVVALAGRDVATRRVDPDVSSVTLAVYSFGAIIPFGVGWTLIHGAPTAPDATGWAILAGVTVSVALAFFLVTAALRKGEVSVIVPFRYTRLLFAMILAVSILGETPDIWVFLGGALIIGSGLYALWRERAVRS